MKKMDGLLRLIVCAVPRCRFRLADPGVNTTRTLNSTLCICPLSIRNLLGRPHGYCAASVALAGVPANAIVSGGC